MKRRDFLLTGVTAPLIAGTLTNIAANNSEVALDDLPPLSFKDVTSGLKITEVKMVNPRRKKPWPDYTPAAGSWSTGGVEVANPMSIYPKYKPQRSLFMKW